MQVIFSKKGADASEHGAAANEKTSVHTGDSTAGELANSLEQKRVELEKKEKDLEAREARLQYETTQLDEKIKQLETIRSGINGEIEKKRKENEERVLKMVSVFETMTPKAAAGVLENLDDWLAAEVLKRMEIKRMAKVMNVMEKSRSAKLSELMTGYYKELKPTQSVVDKSTEAGQKAEPARANASVVQPKERGK